MDRINQVRFNDNKKGASLMFNAHGGGGGHHGGHHHGGHHHHRGGWGGYWYPYWGYPFPYWEYPYAYGNVVILEDKKKKEKKKEKSDKDKDKSSADGEIAQQQPKENVKKTFDLKNIPPYAYAGAIGIIGGALIARADDKNGWLGALIGGVVLGGGVALLTVKK